MIPTVKDIRQSYIVSGVQAQLFSSRRRLIRQPDGESWRALSAIAVSFLVIAWCLFAFGEYHIGFHTLNSATPWLPEHVWAMVTYLGDTATALCLMLFFARRNPAILSVILIAALYGTLVSHGMKDLFALSRPPAVLAEDSFVLIGQGFKRNSFPSGHSLTIFILVSTLFYFSRQCSSRVMLVVFGVVVALSRVMVGAHWPIDILVGAALGILCTLSAIYTAKRWRFGFSQYIYFFVLSLLVIAAFMLFTHDGGYPQAALMGKVLATTALCYAALEYFVLPVGQKNRFVSYYGQ